MDKKVFIGANSRTSGEPLAHKRVRTNPIRWHSVYTEHYTNPMGETRVPGKYDRVWSSYDYGLKVCNHHDVYHTSYESPTCRRYSIPDRKKRIKDLNHDNVRIFTDRTLYRPGQPLYFKVLASKDGKVCADLPLEIELRDKHWKTVDSLKMTTSEFGSAAGQFKIPVSEIGHYSLIVRYKLKSYREDKHLSIEVAEFKLPTFKVALEPDTVETGMGDTLSVHGTVTSLNGVPVSGAAVVLNYIFFSTKVKHEVITDAEGRFNDIFLTPAWDSSYPLGIEVVATDVNGETQSCRSVQRIYMEPLHIGILNLSNVNQTKTDTVRWIIRPENHSKVLLPTPIEVRVERLEMPSDYREYLFQDRKKPSQPLYDEDTYQRYFPQYTLNTNEKSISTWPVAEVLFQTTKVCKPDSLLEIDIRRWPMGQYRATFTGTDKFGNAETVSQTFRITRSDLSLTNRFEPIWVELKEQQEQKKEGASLADRTRTYRTERPTLPRGTTHDVSNGNAQSQECRLGFDAYSLEQPAGTRQRGAMGAGNQGGKASLEKHRGVAHLDDRLQPVRTRDAYAFPLHSSRPRHHSPAKKQLSEAHILKLQGYLQTDITA